jgi:hypothetical protein
LFFALRLLAVGEGGVAEERALGQESAHL